MSWQKSASSPAWMDVSDYLSALDSLHGSTSWLDMSVAGTLRGTSWRVAVVSVFPVVSTPGQSKRLVSVVTWPNGDSADMASAIYKLIVDHDYRISREVYTQERLDLS